MGLLSSLQPGLFAGAGALAQGFEAGAFATTARMPNLALFEGGIAASGMAGTPLSAMIGAYREAMSFGNSSAAESLSQAIAEHIREDRNALNRVLARIPQGLFGSARFGIPAATEVMPVQGMPKSFETAMSLTTSGAARAGAAGRKTLKLAAAGASETNATISPLPPGLRKLAAAKIAALARAGHNEFLSTLLVEKQISHAMRQARILERCLEHTDFAERLPDALSAIGRVSKFLETSREKFLEACGVPLSNDELCKKIRAHLEVEGAAVTEPDLKCKLEEAIRAAEEKKPKIAERSAKLLRQDAETIRNAAFDYCNYFLYSQEYAQDFYEAFLTLARAAGMTVEDVLAKRAETLSESEAEIQRRIGGNGHVTYADFMAMALYDPAHGFYTKARMNPIVSGKGGGEFKTLPEEFDEFGRGIARDLFNRWIDLGRPERFDVIEMGAGQGTMARQILETIEEMKGGGGDKEAFAEAVRYRIVEISGVLSDAQKRKLGKFAQRVECIRASAIDIGEILPPESVTGVFLSNELPDAFPVHKVKMVAGKLREVSVAVRNGVFVEVLTEPSSDEIEKFITDNEIELSEGEERVINLNAIRWLEGMNAALKDGWIMTFDYGYGLAKQEAVTAIHPQFRRYGTARNKEEAAFFGVTGNGDALTHFSILVNLVSEDVGEERLTEALADRLKKTDMPNALASLATQTNGFGEMQEALSDYNSNPLPAAGDTDITTDVDFPTMERAARRIGMRQEIFASQGTYFRKLARSADAKFLEAAGRYKVQIFGKKAGAPMTPPAVPAKFLDLVARGRIETARDAGTFIEFLEAEDFMGLGGLACALKARAREERRPLCDISSDALVQLGAYARTRRNISLGRESEHRRIRVASGTPLHTFLRDLVQLVPMDCLPENFRTDAAQIPSARSGMPFGELVETFFEAQVQSDALMSRIEAGFAAALADAGGAPSMTQMEIIAARTIARRGVESLAEIGRKKEPLRARYQLNALRAAGAFLKGPPAQSLELEDLFVATDGGYKLNPKALWDTAQELWNAADGGGVLSLGKELTAGLSLGDAAKMLARLKLGHLPDAGEFFKLKEEFFARIVGAIARRLEPEKKAAARIAATELGERILPEKIGEPQRITQRPEESRHLLAVFDRYMAYAAHGLAVAPKEIGQGDLLALADVIDPERDTRLFKHLVARAVAEQYTKEFGNFELVRALYEKGFCEKARELVRTWHPDGNKWTPEAVRYFSAKGETELIKGRVARHAAILSGETKDFYLDSLKMLSFSLSDDAEASELFESEWAFIKKIFRVITAYAEKNVYWGDFDKWMREKTGGSEFEGLSFDIFAPGRAERLTFGTFADPGREGEFPLTMVRFLETALKDKRFASRAFEIIEEFGDSPMKLKFYEMASEHIPVEWGQDEIRSFFERWQKTLVAVARQVAENDYIEPAGDFSALPRNIFREDRIGPKQRSRMPSGPAATRLYHKGIEAMMERIDALSSKRSCMGKMPEVAERLFASLEYRRQASFNYSISYDYDDRRYHDTPFFSSGNSCVRMWAKRHRDDTITARDFKTMFDMTKPPVKENYASDFFSRYDADEFRLSYVREFQTYLDTMKEMRGLALRRGFRKEAEDIYRAVRKQIAALVSEISANCNREASETLKEIQIGWAIEEMLAPLLSHQGGGQERAIFDALAARIEADTRNYFGADVIAQAAKETSVRSDYHEYATQLFRIAIDKLAPRRGQMDWLPEGVRTAVAESDLSYDEKDAVYSYALERMWPEGEYNALRYVMMGDSATEAQKLVVEIFENEERYPGSRIFLLQKLAENVKKMDPLRHGKNLGTSFSTELVALASIARHFGARRELLDPANYGALKAIYEDEESALSALENAFPEAIKEDRLRKSQTGLPSVAEIEGGKFDHARLEEDLRKFLAPSQPEPVVAEAFCVLAAWMRKDVLGVMGEAERREEKKEWSERKGIVITAKNLAHLKSYRTMMELAQDTFRAAEPDAFGARALAALFEAKSAKEARAKAFIAYRVLADPNANLAAGRLAFEMLRKDAALVPAYAGAVYDERIAGGGAQREREFFADIALFDHTMTGEKRPESLWAHLFEADDASRARLRAEIARYRTNEAEFAPDLLTDEGWWVFHHDNSSRFYSGSNFVHYLAAWSHQKLLRDMSVAERVGFLFGDNYGYGYREIIARCLAENWPALETADVEEAVRRYIAKYPEGEKCRSLKECATDARENFEELRAKFIEMREAIAENRAPSLGEKANSEDFAAFELLRSAGSEGATKRVDLKAILGARFPKLGGEEIDALYRLANDPFQTVEDIKYNAGKGLWQTETTGRSKDWAGEGGKRYAGETIFREAVAAATSGKLSKNDMTSLYNIMYPFSKSHYLNNFHKLAGAFPHDLPKSRSADGRPEWNIVRHLARNFSRYSSDELDAIGKSLPRRARTHPARTHQMGLHAIRIPKAFEGFHEYALFLVKTYLGMMQIGVLEQIRERLDGQDSKDALTPEDALKEIFKLRDMIKAGQLLGARPELPANFRKQLRELEDGVDASDISDVRYTIEEELGWPADDYEIVKNLNAGSMGEVWLVRHKNYDVSLAVKVLPRKKRERIDAVLKEMEKMREILDWYRDISKESRIAVEVIDKLMALIRNELDFRKDHENWARLFGFEASVMYNVEYGRGRKVEIAGKKPDVRNIKEDGTIPIPETDGFHTAMIFGSAQNALVMSCVDGVNVLDEEEGLRDARERRALAERLWEYLKEGIFAREDGIYPTDLHSGNVMRTKRTGRIVLIDTGQIGRIPLENRATLREFLATATAPGVSTGALIDVISRMGRPYNGDEMDRDSLAREIDALKGDDRAPIDRIRDIFIASAFANFSVGGAYMDVLKAVMSFMGLATRLDPAFTFEQS